MVEIQQNADTTFRLYDWGRLGLDGRPRELHVAQALETAETFLADAALARHEEIAPASLPGGVERLGGLACPSFRIEEVRVPPGRTRLALDPRSLTVVVSVQGSLSARCVDGEDIVTELGAGDSALVPAEVEVLEAEAAEGARFLKTTLPAPGATTG
jgi:mannose-6-phosphate isomerase